MKRYINYTIHTNTIHVKKIKITRVFSKRPIKFALIFSNDVCTVFIFIFIDLILFYMHFTLLPILYQVTVSKFTCS